jgi:TPR repeat protein
MTSPSWFAAATLLCSLLASAPAQTQARAPDPLLRQALSGDKDAQHDLCYAYLYGEEGRRRSYRKAYRWCSAAAAAGVPSALTLLAEMHYLGQHVDESPGMARQFYLIAAEQGHVHAQFMLGHIALQDPRNPDRAQFCRWMQASAAQGYPKARERLDAIEAAWREKNGKSAAPYCNPPGQSPPIERSRPRFRKSGLGIGIAATGVGERRG